MVVGDIVSLLNLRAKTITYLAQKFKRLDLNNDGYIDYNEFCAAFNRDPVKHQKQMGPLFDIFNTDNNNESYDKIGFDEFLVGVSLCFMDNMIDDGIKVMFNGCLNYNTLTVKKQNILDVYTRNVDQKKVTRDDVYREWMHKMKQFVDVIFKSDDEELGFNMFYQRIIDNKMEHMVQHFLQRTRPQNDDRAKTTSGSENLTR